MRKSKIVENCFLVIGLAALSVMVYSYGVGEIWNNISSIGWRFVWILLIWLVTYVMNAAAWQFIICDDRQMWRAIPFAYILKLTITGYAINYTTPVGLMGGEPYRVMELRRFVGTGKATSSVILYSMMHIFSHILFWLFSILLTILVLPVSKPLAYVLGGTFVLCCVLSILFVKICTKGMAAYSLRTLARLPFLGKSIARFNAKNHETIALIDSQISQLHRQSKTRFYVPLLIELAARVFACLEIYLIVLFAGEHLTFLQCVLSVAFTSLFANLFFFLPLQLGTREGGFVLALKAFSFPQSLGMSISMVTRVREFFWIAVGMLIMKVERKNMKAITETSPETDAP